MVASSVVAGTPGAGARHPPPDEPVSLGCSATGVASSAGADFATRVGSGTGVGTGVGTGMGVGVGVGGSLCAPTTSASAWGVRL